MPTLHIPCPTSEISDGYHTFGELYDHRCLLFLAVMRAHPDLAWRSRCHADGSGEAGWWIGGLNLPSGPITYHLPEALWPLAEGLRTLEAAPPWDGHTSAEVLVRLRAWMEASLS